MTDNVTSPSDIASASQSRPVHKFTVPQKLARNTGVTKVGLVQLTPAEERRAGERATNTAVSIGTEYAKESLRVVHYQGEEKPQWLSTGDETTDRVWAAMGPQLRALVIQAHAKLHNPEDEESADFLNSQEVEVG